MVIVGDHVLVLVVEDVLRLALVLVLETVIMGVREVALLTPAKADVTLADVPVVVTEDALVAVLGILVLLLVMMAVKDLAIVVVLLDVTLLHALVSVKPPVLLELVEVTVTPLVLLMVVLVINAAAHVVPFALTLVEPAVKTPAVPHVVLVRTVRPDVMHLVLEILVNLLVKLNVFLALVSTVAVPLVLERVKTLVSLSVRLPHVVINVLHRVWDHVKMMVVPTPVLLDVLTPAMMHAERHALMDVVIPA
jgi:hypothetical protein